MHHKITVYVPHAVTAVLQQRGCRWLSPSQMVQCQAAFLEWEDVSKSVSNSLNSASQNSSSYVKY